MQDKEKNFSKIIEAETERKGLEKTNMKTTIEEITKKWKKQCSAIQEQPHRTSTNRPPPPSFKTAVQLSEENH